MSKSILDDIFQIRDIRDFLPNQSAQRQYILIINILISRYDCKVSRAPTIALNNCSEYVIACHGEITPRFGDMELVPHPDEETHITG
jgi:hypothetical protein